ncbi:hypothetical protein ACFQPG_00270 [Sphingomonas sp. GCM10030256]|uniref:hypothetical protein n=1 Tax=Sphingomonas sp. GCM10030256 TaxID=3273427 RepID=UPI0036241031
MSEEDVWKRRFAVFALVRLAGLAIFFLGIAIAFSDWLRVGGWPVLGIPIALAGLADAVLAPRLLKRVWERQPR